MTESSSSDIDARKRRAEAEHRRVADLLSEAEEGDAGSHVWVPTPHVALGRRDHGCPKRRRERGRP
ncbi:MAG: hypothetical protein SV760_02420 [Halobacteria archaeon]|nr:hypothetical protein [Halobacteria archaeon]